MGQSAEIKKLIFRNIYKTLLQDNTAANCENEAEVVVFQPIYPQFISMDGYLLFTVIQIGFFKRIWMINEYK
ncbi:hypothetical protein RIR_jg22923.t1 [Rhizophagus irregularis DAOM 181602=DAOM 197198]|nr:hypothetical protein RhiirB3_456190 [Rhizophagus irregularis]GET62571.1 hypothetical protein RIR_jg22923.t1 [Rhizophagus irregularis DAOM 181602=DAOM 197198]